MPVLAPLSTFEVRPPDGPAAAAAATAASRLLGSASHSVTSCSAWVTSAGPSEMPFLTPTSTRGLPAKRPASLTGRSWAKITASAAAISAALSGVEPAEPWVSTFIV